MGAAYFYHLTDRPLEATLPVLISKSLEAGWRVTVRGTDDAQLARLDNVLWQGDGFLPHGISGGPHDGEQPVLLTKGAGGNEANCLMAVDGADVSKAEITDLARTCILFDGNDPTALEKARGQWRSLTEAGVQAQYWAEDGGRWVKKAESKKPD